MKLFLVILQLSLVLSAKFLAKEEDVSGLNELNEAPVDAADAEEVKLEMARMKEEGGSSDDDTETAETAETSETSEEGEDEAGESVDEEEKMMQEAPSDLPEEEDTVELAAANSSFLQQTLAETEVKEIPGVGKVLMKTEKGVSWVLLMKLSKNEFCEGDKRWTNGKAHNPEKMLDSTFPDQRGYDAKSLAFHRLKGIDAVKLQTNTANFEEAPEVYFKFADTAERLITTNFVDIIGTGDFNTKKYFDGPWTKAYGNSRKYAPAFMRGGEFVKSPEPECRTNPEDKPSGCGQPCVFCMQAGDGDKCGVRSAHNDISKGIGLSGNYCGGGDRNDCSSSGNWAGDRRTLLWGRLASGYRSTHTVYSVEDGGDVLVREEGGDSWALVMKLSKNDFCHGSPRWTDGVAFKPEKMFDDSFPGHQEYDAKSLAFHKLEGVSALKIQTNTASFSDAVVIEFANASTPEKLITTNDIKIKPTGGFNSQAFWKKWEGEYGHSRQRAPAFMRADEFVKDPAPQCRSDPGKVSGCGKACVFCMQVADGSGCPATTAANDISVGIGLSANYCGGGNRADCSSSGNWVGDRTTLVWAKWECKKHDVGQCKGTRHMGVCGDLEVDDCDTHFVHVLTDEDKVEGAFLQCSTVDGQCVATGPACYGSCANGRTA